MSRGFTLIEILIVVAVVVVLGAVVIPNVIDILGHDSGKEMPTQKLDIVAKKEVDRHPEVIDHGKQEQLRAPLDD